MSEESKVVSIRTNSDGKKVKVTTTVTTKLIPIESTGRYASFERYGEARKGNENVPKKEEINLRLFPKSVRQKEGADQPEKAVTQTKYVCRTCTGDHLSYQCPNKDKIATADSVLGTPGVGSTPRIGAPGVGPSLTGNGPQKYISPALRAAMSGGLSGPQAAALQRETNTTLRVSNLSDMVTEQYLRSNFSTFGRVVRCHMPQSKMTGRPRGFAFIEFDTHDAAERARKTCDNIPVMNMIMHVEFAQPRE